MVRKHTYSFRTDAGRPGARLVLGGAVTGAGGALDEPEVCGGVEPRRNVAAQEPSRLSPRQDERYGDAPKREAALGMVAAPTDERSMSDRALILAG